MVKCLPEFEYFYCILKNRNFISEIRRSKVTDYAALNCSELTPKETQPLPQNEKGGVEKRKLIRKWSARELKLNCRSNAKESNN